MGVLNDDTDLYGKTASDLMTDVSIADNVASGTLKFVSDYSTAFPAGENIGHYIALKALSNAVVTAEVVGGLHDPVKLDADGIIVAYITATTQKVKFVATLGTQTKTVEIALTGLTLAEE